jgi:hypothetical protein
MPKWLVQILLERQEKISHVDPAQWEEMVTMGVVEGQRNVQMTRLVGYLWHKHEPPIVLGLALSVNAARCRPPMPQKDVEKICQSIQRRENQKNAQQSLLGANGVEV